MKVTRALNLKQHEVNSMGSNQDPLKVNEKPEYNFERKKKPLTMVLNSKLNTLTLKEILKIQKLKFEF